MDLPTAGEVQWFVVSFELVPDFGFVPVNPASPLAQRYVKRADSNPKVSIKGKKSLSENKS